MTPNDNRRSRGVGEVADIAAITNESCMPSVGSRVLGMRYSMFGAAVPTHRAKTAGVHAGGHRIL